MNIIEVAYKWNGTFQNGENQPNKIVLHNADATKCTVQDIDSWHKNNGWAGIGYHYLVRKDGSVYRGRKESWRGAHCPPANTTSIGICFEGKYMVETMPKAQFDAGQELIADIRSRYGNLPIYGHRDLYSTDCPGANFPLNDFKNGTINNVESEDDDYMSKVYQNGSTKEVVYSDSNCTMVLGSLDPYESCTCIYEWEGKAVVLYKVSGTDNEKVGFVKWTGGIK